jgi:hypothetical protein
MTRVAPARGAVGITAYDHAIIGKDRHIRMESRRRV